MEIDTNAIMLAYTLLVDFVLAGFVVETLRRGGASQSQRYLFSGLLLGWLAFLGWRLATHQLFPADLSGPALFAILIALVAVVAAAPFLSPVLRKIVRIIPQELLLLPQGLRAFLGAGFLMAASLGQMPVLFGIADGMTHITAAFLALKTGLLWAHGEKCTGPVLFANLFGLLDIVTVALGLSFVILDDITPNHTMMAAAFFAAPLFVALHFASLSKLMFERSEHAPRSCQSKTRMEGACRM